MTPRTLQSSVAKNEPWQVWNAYVDLLAVSSLETLDSVQRPAALVFAYESEIQNGGHLQYFENRREDRKEEVIESLDRLGAAYHADLLRAASALWQKEDRSRISSAEDYVDEALEEEFSEFDRRFHEAPTSLVTVLEDYLKRFQHHFVVVT